MKKLMSFSILALASAAAWAQGSPSLQLYGLVDAGLTRVSGLTKGTDNKLASGIMEGSRWGLKGTEDISPGWKALFLLEARLELNDGSISNRPASGGQLPDRFSNAALMGLPLALQPAVDRVGAALGTQVGVNLPGRYFDRQVYVGLVTPVGALLAGRMYTPAYELGSYFDILGTQSALAPGQLLALPSGIDIRASNALSYRITSGPITASLMATTSEDKTGQPHVRAGMVMYKSDSFSAGIAHNTRRNEVDEKSLTNTVIGASYETGAHKVSVEGATIKDDHPSNVSTIAAQLTPAVGAALGGVVQAAFTDAFKQDARLYHVGYRYLAGPNTVYLAYNTLRDRLREADTDSYGMAYSYALSKRTDVNLVLVHYNNKDLAQTAPGGNGYLGGVTAEAGKDSNSIALGLRHRF